MDHGCFDDTADLIGLNGVRLTMSATNLVDKEFIAEWNFNFDPSLDPAPLTFTLVGVPGSVPNSISTGVDAFKADGDGFFDINFGFPPPPGNFAKKFTALESVVYDIGYVSPITALAFDFYSAGGGGNGSFRSAAHIQGIGSDDNDSGWIGADGTNPPPPPIPEPSSMVVWALGLVGCAALARLRRGNASVRGA